MLKFSIYSSIIYCLLLFLPIMMVATLEIAQVQINQQNQLRNLSEAVMSTMIESYQTDKPAKPDEETSDRPSKPPKPDDETSDKPSKPPKPDDETSDKPSKPSTTENQGDTNTNTENDGSFESSDEFNLIKVIDVRDSEYSEKTDSTYKAEAFIEVAPLTTRRVKFISLLDQTDLKFFGMFDNRTILEFSYKERNDEFKRYNMTITDGSEVKGIKAESIDIIIFNINKTFSSNVEVSVSSFPIGFIIAGISGFLFIGILVALFLILGSVGFTVVSALRKRARKRRGESEGKKNKNDMEFKITNSIQVPVGSIKYPSIKSDSRITPDDQVLVVGEKNNKGREAVINQYKQEEVHNITTENDYPYFTEQTRQKITIKSEIIIQSERTIRSKSFEPINPNFMTHNQPKSVKQEPKKLVQLDMN